MPKIDIYVAVRVTVDTDTRDIASAELSSFDELPLDFAGCWDHEREEWRSMDTDEEALGYMADDFVMTALSAELVREVSKAAQMVARIDAGDAPDQQELLDVAEPEDDEATVWKFKDGSRMRLTREGEFAEVVTN